MVLVETNPFQLLIYTNIPTKLISRPFLQVLLVKQIIEKLKLPFRTFSFTFYVCFLV